MTVPRLAHNQQPATRTGARVAVARVVRQVEADQGELGELRAETPPRWP
jgi:hypothetical protein